MNGGRGYFVSCPTLASPARLPPPLPQPLFMTRPTPRKKRQLVRDSLCLFGSFIQKLFGHFPRNCEVPNFLGICYFVSREKSHRELNLSLDGHWRVCDHGHRGQCGRRRMLGCTASTPTSAAIVHDPADAAHEATAGTGFSMPFGGFI